MPETTEADAKLEKARALINRAPVYEAISIPTALVAGTFSLVNAAISVWWLVNGARRIIDIRAFVLSWLAVLAASLLTGLHFLWREHARREGPLLTLGLRAAARAVLPAGAAAAGVTVLFFWNGAAFSLSISWITLYGLALLATSYFAPRPLVVLGSAFLITGIGMMLFIHLRIMTLIGYSRGDLQTTLLMAFTFGVYHVIYAVSVSAMRRQAP